MLLQLTVDMADADPDTRSAVAQALGRSAAEMFARGHKCDLHTIDYSSLPDTPDEDTPEQARAKGYAEGYDTGYSKGFGSGYDTGRQDHQQIILPVTPPPAPTLPDPARPAWPGHVSNPFLPEPFGTYPAFPDQLHTPADLRQHTVGDTPTPNETTVIQPGGYTDTTIGQAVAPDGPRPEAVPGAPISAYDTLRPGVAHSAYGFPEYPDDRQKFTDTEGAQWVYSALPQRQWVRRSFPRVWGSAASGEFPAIDINAHAHPHF